MLLSITNTRRPATDLGYLLHKHPARAQTFDLTFGSVHLSFPEAGEERCTCSLLFDIDPAALARSREKFSKGSAPVPSTDAPLYIPASFISVGIAEVLTSALNGKCRERPELVEEPLPLFVRVDSVACRGGERLIRGLFEPLGYAVAAELLAPDPAFPERPENGVYAIELSGTLRLRDLLSHLYILLPALDGEKHYWVGDDEVEKLVLRGGEWLAAHPERGLIARRYLRRQGSLARNALARLGSVDREEWMDREESDAEEGLGLRRARVRRVVGMLKEIGAARVLDAACGRGELLGGLAGEIAVTEIIGMDASPHALENAAAALALLPEEERRRVTLIQGTPGNRDRRIGGFDAAVILELIEHLDADQLAMFEQSIFRHARPGTVIITTPDSDYNTMWPRLSAGGMRHRDHRFEWTREEFQAWGTRVAGAHGYAVSFLPVGEAREGHAPTQMGVFRQEIKPVDER